MGTVVPEIYIPITQQTGIWQAASAKTKYCLDWVAVIRRDRERERKRKMMKAKWFVRACVNKRGR
jgi:hypothetical protein